MRVCRCDISLGELTFHDETIRPVIRVPMPEGNLSDHSFMQYNRDHLRNEIAPHLNNGAARCFCLHHDKDPEPRTIRDERLPHLRKQRAST